MSRKFTDIIRAPFKMEKSDWELCKKAAKVEGRSPSNWARHILIVAAKKLLGKNYERRKKTSESQPHRGHCP